MENRSAKNNSSITRRRADVSNPRSFRCPFHDDNHPSAGIFQFENIWLFKCHGCTNANGDVYDVLAAHHKCSRDEAIEQAHPKEQDGKRPASKYTSSKATPQGTNTPIRAKHYEN